MKLPEKTMSFGEVMPLEKAIDELTELFKTTKERVLMTFNTYFEKLPPSARIYFFDVPRTPGRPGCIPAYPFRIIAVDNEDKPVLVLLVSYPLMKNELCSILRHSDEVRPEETLPFRDQTRQAALEELRKIFGY